MFEQPHQTRKNSVEAEELISHFSPKTGDKHMEEDPKS